MWWQPSIGSGSLIDFIRRSKSTCEWNKRHTDKAHTLPWMTQLLSSGPATCIQLYTLMHKLRNRTCSAHWLQPMCGLHPSLHICFSVLSVYLESNSFISLWILIYSSLEVAPFDGKATDLFAGQHLKYLSPKTGVWVVLSAVFVISAWVRVDQEIREGVNSPSNQLLFNINKLLKLRGAWAFFFTGQCQDHQKPGILIGKMPETPVLAVWNAIQALPSSNLVMYFCMRPFRFQKCSQNREWKYEHCWLSVLDIRCEAGNLTYKGPVSICVSQSCSAPVVLLVRRVWLWTRGCRTSVTFSITPQLSLSQLLP